MNIQAFRKQAVVVVCLWAMAGIVTSVSAEDRIKLRVSMFPYVPDPTPEFVARFEKEFETQYSGIDIEISCQPAHDPYNLDFVKTSLMSDPVPSRFDLMELDMVMLGEVLREDLIKPWEGNLPWLADVIPAAKEGSKRVRLINEGSKRVRLINGK